MRRRKTSDNDVIIRELSEEEKLENIKKAAESGEDNGNEVEPDDEIPFTTKLRQATRKVHNVSDALVNAKLGLAMSDEKVWAEGLLIFYEIFKYLEEALERQSPRITHFQKMGAVIHEIQRTTAFEQDLKYYFGENYLRTYSIRPSVSDYLKHLRTLEEREPLRLLAYVYHLYMGLLSGGQILKRKRELRKKLTRGFGEVLGWFGFGMLTSRRSIGSSVAKRGNAVTSFAIDGRSINDIKKEIAFTMNDIASDLSKDEKESLISESMMVFQRNNEVVGSIERTGITALKNITGSPVLWLVTIIAIGSLFMYIYSCQPSDSHADSMIIEGSNSYVDTNFEDGADGFLQ